MSNFLEIVVSVWAAISLFVGGFFLGQVPTTDEQTVVVGTTTTATVEIQKGSETLPLKKEYPSNEATTSAVKDPITQEGIKDAGLPEFFSARDKYYAFQEKAVSLKVGDSLNGYPITKIERRSDTRVGDSDDVTKIHTSGEITVSGVPLEYGEHQVLTGSYCFLPAKNEYIKINPEHEKLYEFCFRNRDFAKETFAHLGGSTTTNVTVVVKDYMHDFRESEVTDYATLVRMVK